MRTQALLTALAVTMMTVACNKSMNPKLQAPPEHFTPMTIEAGQTRTIAEPKVNILFVVDNSGSMKDHQAKLKANIDVFADKFFDNPRIDYKIGVVPVYDSVHPKIENLNNLAKRERELARKMNPLGELVSLKDVNGQTLNSAPYITRETPDAKNVLKNTVAIGVQWGPEAEESFSPVLEVISNEKLNKTKNAGFYDKDAYLVVIFLTDADDATPGVSANEFIEELRSAKDGNKNKILIAAALPSTKVSSATCKLDGNGPQYQFPELVRISGALRADLCSDSFGQRLAEFGEKVVQTVGVQRISLGFIPDVQYKVTYGTKEMKPEERQILVNGVDYNFNERTNEILLGARLNIKRVDGGEVFVEATPVKMDNLKTGRLKPNYPAPAAQAQ